MCTRARLVQADKVSPWSGMDHAAGAPRWQPWELTPDMPAQLEVTVDPAAHGPSGLGPISRGVMLQTSGGQDLQLVLRAVVTAG